MRFLASQVWEFIGLSGDQYMLVFRICQWKLQKQKGVSLISPVESSIFDPEDTLW